MSRQRTEDGAAIVSRLACMDLPKQGGQCRSAADLLAGLVAHSDPRGRYFADPRLLRRLFWWQDIRPSQAQAWLDALIVAGEVEVRDDGEDIYSGSPVPIVHLVNRQRFPRFAGRLPIPLDVRREVYARDGHRCVTCGSNEALSLDHIHPWSKGGADSADNLQTLCRPCNSRKGARVDA